MGKGKRGKKKMKGGGHGGRPVNLKTLRNSLFEMERKVDRLGEIMEEADQMRWEIYGDIYALSDLIDEMEYQEEEKLEQEKLDRIAEANGFGGKRGKARGKAHR